jgi:hypothetical protein
MLKATDVPIEKGETMNSISEQDVLVIIGAVAVAIIVSPLFIACYLGHIAERLKVLPEIRDALNELVKEQKKL